MNRKLADQIVQIEHAFESPIFVLFNSRSSFEASLRE